MTLEVSDYMSYQFNIKLGYFCSISLLLMTLFAVRLAMIISSKFSSDEIFVYFLSFLLAALIFVGAGGFILTLIRTVYEHIMIQKRTSNTNKQT